MRDPIFHRTYDYDRNLLPNAHLRALETGVTNLEEARKRTGESIGYPGWGALYYFALCSLRRDRPNTIIEIGANWGSTTIVLAEALARAGTEGHLFAFEVDKENAEVARRNIAAAGLADRVTLIEGDLKSKLGEFAGRGCKVDFAFLAGAHLLKEVVATFEAVLPVLSPDALVCFKNTYKIADDGEDARVFGALKEIRRRFGGNLINLPSVSVHTPGMAVWQRQPLGERAGAMGRPGGVHAKRPKAELITAIGKEKFFHAMDLGEVVTQSQVYGTELPPNYHLYPAFQYMKEMSLAEARCLDLGTFDGMTAFQLCELGAREVHANCQYTLNRFLLVHALKGYETLHYHPDTHLEDLPDILEPGSTDLVVISSMLHHHPAPSAALLAVRKLLRRGGYFILEAAVTLTDPPETELNTIAADPVFGNPTISIPSERTLRGLLNLAAFEVESVTTLVGTEAGQLNNYRRITFLARAVLPAEISNRSKKLAEIQDSAQWVTGIDFRDLEKAGSNTATLAWNGERGERILPIWFAAPSIPLQPRWSDPKPARGTSARIATNDRFMDLMARRSEYRWTPKDVSLLAAKYPGVRWTDAMDWSLKQCGNLFCIDHMIFHGPIRVLEIGAGINMYFQNRLPHWMEYWAIDDAGFYEPGLVDLARTMHRNGRYVQGTIGQPGHSLPDGYFECTFSVSVIEHVPREKIVDAARDMWRVTRAGGWTLHSLDLPVEHAKAVAGLWIDALKSVGFVLDKDAVDLEADKARGAGMEVFLEPMSIVQEFHHGHCPEPWLRKPMPSLHNRHTTVLLALRKPPAAP